VIVTRTHDGGFTPVAGWEYAAATPLRAQLSADTLPQVSSDDTDSVMEDAEKALHDARARLAEIPAQTVVVNHVMGLYELAAIHLGAAPPRLGEASLAIDAVGCLVEGLGDRLGPDASTLNAALANIRLAFVQIKAAGITDE
jgi:hypothetical protein